MINTCSISNPRQHSLYVTTDNSDLNYVETVAPSSLQSPRKDNFLEKLLIFLLSFLLVRIVLPTDATPESNKKLHSQIKFGMTFQDFTMLTKELLFQSDKFILRNQIVNLLRSVIPETLRNGFKTKYIIDPQWISEKSSEWMSFGLLEWLVGPVERFNINMKMIQMIHIENNTVISAIAEPTAAFNNAFTPMTYGNSNDMNIVNEESNSTLLAQSLITTVTTTGNWTSGAKLIECRYLMESGCKATCLYVCKGPTQQFFLNELGVPLYMKPDFNNSSCELQFGVLPPPIEQDPAYQEACFSSCPSKSSKIKRTLC